MIDFHSHILPAIDDGSKDTEESLKLLQMLLQQGVDTVVATPHFLPERESALEFLHRRETAYKELSSHITEDLPDIILGAEVAYYEGINRLEGLSELCVGNSRLLLMEMPMNRWSETAVKELISIACSNNIRLVLAHVERYISYQSKDNIQKLLDCGILFQVNASFFNDFRTRHKAFSMLRQSSIHFIGSDCHNLTYRPPCIGQAFDLIRKKSGDMFLQDFTEFQRSLIFSENG